MSNTYTHTMQVRISDCDAFGFLDPEHYLHYMVETSFAHDKEVNAINESWSERGVVWMIRETEIEFMRPIIYGDSVEITTTIGNYSKTRGTRFYEFHEKQAGKLFARSQSEIFALDIKKQRPIPIPEFLFDIYKSEGDSKKTYSRKQFPIAPPPPPKVFRMRKKVEWHDIDLFHHANHAAYLRIMKTAGMEFGEEIGLPIRSTLNQNWAILNRRSHIKYLGQAKIGDELEIALFDSNMELDRWNRHYKIIRISDGMELIRGYINLVWVEVETFEPSPIPSEALVTWDGYISKATTV